MSTEKQNPDCPRCALGDGWDELREKLRVAIADRDEAERLEEWGTYQHCSGLVIAYQNAFAVLEKAHPNVKDQPTAPATPPQGEGL